MKKPAATHPERGQTDASLRVEREKTDRALIARQAAVEAGADAAIDRARVTADAVVDEARTSADLRATAAPASVRQALSASREHEDEALHDERAAADALLERERTETRAALAKLLPLERTKTDRHLLTERRHADDVLSHRDDFLGIVSHDLRNLLGGIVTSAGMVEAMAGGGAAAPHVLTGTARIQRYAARMNRLIGDLQDVAAIDNGRLSVRLVPGNLMTAIEETIERFEADAAAAQLTIDAPSDGPALTAVFDHDRMLQVLGNLLANAIKFTAPGGSIRIAGARDTAGVQVSVSDTGRGIPPELCEAVFERFWQGRDDERRGMGLGLYISKSIVTAHGGTIDVESVPGQGSTFTVTLPPPG